MFGAWTNKTTEPSEPVTRSGHLTAEARAEAARKLEEKKEAGAKKRLEKKLSNLSISNNKSQEDSDQDSDIYYNNFDEVPELSAKTMSNYDELNTADDPEYYKKPLDCKFDTTDIEFWFTQLEDLMTFAGVGKQFTKRRVLAKNLPDRVKKELKSLLLLTEAQAGNNAYKQCKNRLLDLYAPKDIDAFAKAEQLVLPDKPSQLATQIVDLLCKCHPPLPDGCCAVRAVTGLWHKQLPEPVRTAIAGRKMTGEHYEKTLQHADDVFAAMQGPKVASVEVTDNAAGGAGAGQQVAAFNRGRGGRGRGRGQRGRGGRGRGQNNNNQNNNQGQTNTQSQNKKHEDNPPDSCCTNHLKYGRQAHFCRNIASCPWKDYVSPPQDNK